jgi:hypothetical protein
LLLGLLLMQLVAALQQTQQGASLCTCFAAVFLSVLVLLLLVVLPAAALALTSSAATNALHNSSCKLSTTASCAGFGTLATNFDQS